MTRVARLFLQTLQENMETLGIISDTVDYQPGPFCIYLVWMFNFLRSLRSNQMVPLEVGKQSERVDVLD